MKPSQDLRLLTPGPLLPPGLSDDSLVGVSHTQPTRCHSALAPSQVWGHFRTCAVGPLKDQKKKGCGNFAHNLN